LVNRADVADIKTATGKNTHLDPVHDRARKPHPEACARVLPVMIDDDCVVSQQRLTAFH